MMSKTMWMVASAHFLIGLVLSLIGIHTSDLIQAYTTIGGVVFTIAGWVYYVIGWVKKFRGD